MINLVGELHYIANPFADNYYTKEEIEAKNYQTEEEVRALINEMMPPSAEGMEF